MKKQRRCKDCKWYDGPMGYSCVIEWLLCKPIGIDECQYYARKRWKLWAAK